MRGILKKIFCDHEPSFKDRRKAEILVKELNKRSIWKKFYVKKCKMCGEYYTEGEYTREINTGRKELR